MSCPVSVPASLLTLRFPYGPASAHRPCGVSQRILPASAATSVHRHCYALEVLHEAAGVRLRRGGGSNSSHRVPRKWVWWQSVMECIFGCTDGAEISGRTWASRVLVECCNLTPPHPQDALILWRHCGWSLPRKCRCVRRRYNVACCQAQRGRSCPLTIHVCGCMLCPCRSLW